MMIIVRTGYYLTISYVLRELTHSIYSSVCLFVYPSIIIYTICIACSERSHPKAEETEAKNDGSRSQLTSTENRI